MNDVLVLYCNFYKLKFLIFQIFNIKNRFYKFIKIINYYLLKFLIFKIFNIKNRFFKLKNLKFKKFKI